MRLISFAVIFLLATTAAAEERAVQLLLPSRQLEPTSTFELRFANEMVPADQVGKPAPISPLVLAPAMKGQLVWLSTRSGTFAPKGVLPLGTRYQISLRPGLKDAAGRAVTATLKETAETPPMRVKGVSTLSGGQADDAPAMPRYLILFNANVNAAACAKFFRFTNVSGGKIEARVGQAGDVQNRVRSATNLPVSGCTRARGIVAHDIRDLPDHFRASVYVVDPDVPSTRRIPLAANGGTKMKWESESLSCRSEPGADFALAAEGEHRIVVTDLASGRRAETWIRIRSL